VRAFVVHEFDQSDPRVGRTLVGRSTDVDVLVDHLAITVLQLLGYLGVGVAGVDQLGYVSDREHRAPTASVVLDRVDEAVTLAAA